MSKDSSGRGGGNGSGRGGGNSDESVLTGIMPSAAPTAEELALWHALPHDQQVAGFARALRQGFASPAAAGDIEAIVAETKAELKRQNHG